MTEHSYDFWDLQACYSLHSSNEQHYLQALPIFRTLGDLYDIADCFRMLGLFAMQRKDFDIAAEYAQEVLALTHQMESVESESLALLSIVESIQQSL